MMQRSNPSPLSVKALGASLVFAWISYATVFFPGRRVFHWFELCTDGLAPDWLASDAQDVLGSYWRDALQFGYLNDIAGVVIDHMSKWGGRGDVLELAAGAGSAPAVWYDLFQEQGLCTRSILTDIQPRPHEWEFLRQGRLTTSGISIDEDDDDEQSDACGTFSYVAAPVDAAKAHSTVTESIPTWGSEGKEMRMIHLSLHHFEPEIAHQIIEDAAQAKAAVLIIDHSPTAGDALYNGALATKQMLKNLPGILLRNPIKLLLAPAFPLIVAGLWHDATVSILRSYSQDELRQMILSSEDGKDYNIQMFRSPSYGEWLGIPSFLWLPGMEDHVMNFVLATPTNHYASPFGPTHDEDVKQVSTTPRNYTVKVERTKMYGMPVKPKSQPLSAGMQAALLMLLGIVSYAYLGPKADGKRGRATSEGDQDLLGKPAILAIGTANPPHPWTTDDMHIGLDWKKNNIELGDDFVPFMKKVHATNGIDTRYFGCPPPDQDHVNAGGRPEGMYGKDGNPKPSERQAYWAEWAPKMAIEAAHKAVARWGGNKDKITHVVFHSCTGFKAPGVELDVIDALKLTNVKRRLGINYMGCFGGFTGMAVAKAFCEADPNAYVLVVCAETCFAHFAFCDNRSKTIGNCIFADGAGAAIVGPGTKPGDWVIDDQETKTLGIETRNLMTWQPNDHNYDMYLDKGIGYSFGKHLYWNLKSYLKGISIHSVHDVEWCVHPGGKGILDFFCSDKLALGIDKSTLDRSYDVLRRFGNMSSATIFFVLEELMKEAEQRPTEIKPNAFCCGFGPGLTLEIAVLRRIGSSDEHCQSS